MKKLSGRAACAASWSARSPVLLPEYDKWSDPAAPVPNPVRHRGIRQRFTKPYSPTTTGKVERWHQTLQNELLNDAGPFTTLEEAQAAVDEWREEYNHRRPH